jgi:hypothetical protein
MAATVHLTLVAPDNEKFTVQSAPADLGVLYVGDRSIVLTLEPRCSGDSGR